MKYYLHDSNSFQDEKIEALYNSFGYEGLGLFYTLLEKLAIQEKPVKTETLKRQLFVGKRLEKCWKFMEDIGIIHSSDGETFNKQLLTYAENYKIKSVKNKERIAEWREKQALTKNVTSYETITNELRNTHKVKVSKVKVLEKEVKEVTPLALPFSSEEFSDVWNILIKEKKWKGKSQAALEESLKKLEKYSEADAIEMMRNAISGGYQGVFPVDKTTSPAAQKIPVSRVQQGMQTHLEALEIIKNNRNAPRNY